MTVPGSSVTRSIQGIYAPIRSDSGETLMMRSLVECIESADPARALNLTPDYQRGYVWTERQAQQFVGHLVEGGHVAPVIINRFPTATGPLQADEVIDGHQRLRSTYRWLKGEIVAELSDGSTLHLDNLNAHDRALVTGYWLTGPRFSIMYVSLSRPDRLRLYLRLNRGGTVHSDDEIARVRGLLESETKLDEVMNITRRQRLP